MPITDITSIASSLRSAEQIDKLHIDLSTLMELSEKAIFEAVLDLEPAAATKQLVELIPKLETDQLAQFLKEKTSEPDFFRRHNLEPAIHSLQKAAESIEIIGLTVACKFTPEDLEEMADLLAKRIGKPVAFNIEIDKDLIGGAIVQHGNYLSDYSLKTRLQQLRENWQDAVTDQK